MADAANPVMDPRADARRRARARAGSLKDVRVRLLRVGLPLVVGALAAVMLLSPFSVREETGFLLEKDKVAPARERLRTTAATYRGLDDRSRPFEVSAASAVQRTSASRLIELGAVSARLTLDDGPATLATDAGAFDRDARTLSIPGRVTLAAAPDYRLVTDDVLVNLGRRVVTGTGGVSGELPIGRFSARTMRVDLDARIVRLDGDARLTINQGALR